MITNSNQQLYRDVVGGAMFSSLVEKHGVSTQSLIERFYTVFDEVNSWQKNNVEKPLLPESLDDVRYESKVWIDLLDKYLECNTPVPIVIDEEFQKRKIADLTVEEFQSLIRETLKQV